MLSKEGRAYIEYLGLVSLFALMVFAYSPNVFMFLVVLGADIVFFKDIFCVRTIDPEEEMMGRILKNQQYKERKIKKYRDEKRLEDEIRKYYGV